MLRSQTVIDCKATTFRQFGEFKSSRTRSWWTEKTAKTVRMLRSRLLQRSHDPTSEAEEAGKGAQTRKPLRGRTVRWSASECLSSWLRIYPVPKQHLHHLSDYWSILPPRPWHLVFLGLNGSHQTARR